MNLFERGLPRLSVDIDLCYPRFSERSEALSAIISSLDAIKQDLSKRLPDIKFSNDKSPAREYKLLCRTPQAVAKIDSDRAFLLSFKEGDPDWRLLDVEKAQKLPAILWKLQNIRKLIELSPKKHQNQFAKLKEVLNV